MLGELGLSAAFSVIIALFVYLIPSFIAQVRTHHNASAILALNLFLGWTVLGWIAAFIWALTRPPTTSHGGTT